MKMKCKTRQIHAQTKVWTWAPVWEYFTFYISFCSFGDLSHFFSHSLSGTTGSRMIINNSKRNFSHSPRDQISARCKHNSLLTRNGPRTPPLIEAWDYQFCTPQSPLQQSRLVGRRLFFFVAFLQITASQRHGIANFWFYYVVKV